MLVTMGLKSKTHNMLTGVQLLNVKPQCHEYMNII